MDGIRTLTRDDIPDVARLCQRAFLSPRRQASAALVDYLDRLFLDGPDRDDEIASKVMTTGGRVTGFIGALPLPMTFQGRPIRAAVPSSLVVEDPRADPLGGARLVRAFLQGPQDISISEPANNVAIGLWRRLGGVSVPSESLEWLVPFGHAGVAVALAGRRARPLAGAARLADRWLGRRRPGRIGLPKGVSVEEVDAAGFAEAWPDLILSYALRPDFSPAALAWRLDHAAANATRGPLRLAVVRGRAGPIGAFAYQGKRGGIAHGIQVLATPDGAPAVIDALLLDAADKGCVGVKGRTQARLLERLLERGALLFRRHGAVVHMRDPDLADCVRAGDAITGGLVGESWMRHVSDRTL